MPCLTSNFFPDTITASGSVFGGQVNYENPIYKLGDVFRGLTNIQNRKKLIFCHDLIENCSRKGFDDYKGGCLAINLEDEGDIFSPSTQDYFFDKELNDAIIGMKKEDGE